MGRWQKDVKTASYRGKLKITVTGVSVSALCGTTVVFATLVPPHLCGKEVTGHTCSGQFAALLSYGTRLNDQCREDVPPWLCYLRFSAKH